MQIAANSSRLVRFLAELGVAAGQAPPRNFSERMGQLFDLHDSIKISAVHARATATFEPTGVSREAVRADFLRARATIVNSALQSFTPGGGQTRLRFPTVTAQISLEATMTCEPYLAFYAARQRAMDFRIRDLQAATREALSGLSPRLARLAALDAALGEPLSTHHRHFFAAVGDLLRQRIEHQIEQYRRAAELHEERLWAATVAQIRADMQGLLLAEIETRLLPTLGLIEALDEQDED